MVREELMIPLHAAISEAKQKNKTVCKKSVRVKQGDDLRRVNLEVIPLKNLKE